MSDNYSEMDAELAPFHLSVALVGRRIIVYSAAAKLFKYTCSPNFITNKRRINLTKDEGGIQLS